MILSRTTHRRRLPARCAGAGLCLEPWSPCGIVRREADIRRDRLEGPRWGRELLGSRIAWAGDGALGSAAR